jgi:hypothetical protein
MGNKEKVDTDMKMMKMLKAPRVEDTRETVLPESLNVNML